MGRTKAENCRQPHGKNECGFIEIDLGEWWIDGIAETLHMRIDTRKLGILAQQISHRPGRARAIGGRAVDVFIAARPERMSRMEKPIPRPNQ